MTDLDTTFNSPFGFVTNGFNFNPPNDSSARGIALQTDGKIVMAGDTQENFTVPPPGGVNSYVAVCRYNTNGTLDNSFGTSGLTTFLIPVFPPSLVTNSLTIQPTDGSIVVCGYKQNSSGFNEMFIVRFTSNGILDTNFASPNGFILITPTMFMTAYSLTVDNCYAVSVKIDTSTNPNKIVIGGHARVLPAIPPPNSLSFFALARLDLNGVLDGGFGINGLVLTNFSGQNETGLSLAIGNGNYFLAGSTTGFAVAKFDTVGNPVVGFGSSGLVVIPAFVPSSLDGASSMLVQPDGNIVLAGTSYSNPPFPASPTQSYALARLDGISGILDTSFGIGGKVITNLSAINIDLNGASVAIQPDGKIVLGGRYFNVLIPNTSFSLARYNVNGSLDTTFGINGNGLILEDLVPGTMQEIGYSVAIQTDGKILLGGVKGEFSDISDEKEFILARYLGFPPFPIPIVPICFPAGTPVTTDQGEISIEEIDPDFHTILNKKIIAITETITLENNIVCFEKNSLGYNIPNKRTHISKNHCIKYNDNLIEAYKFVGRLRGVYFEKYNGELLYNILMEKHYIIKINNLKVETLNPNNFVAHLYTNDYTNEEKKNIILKMNEQTKKNIILNTNEQPKKNANTINNTTSLRNIQYTRKSYHQNRLYNNYFVTKLHNRTIRNYSLFQKEKHNSNTLKYKPFIIKKNHYIGKTHKRFNR